MRSTISAVLALPATIALASACSFSPGQNPLIANGGAGADPGTGAAGSTGGMYTGTGGFTAGPDVDAGDPIVKDSGMCIREPGQDTCMPLCAVESHVADQLPPDILIVLDKSLSMNESTTNMRTCTGTCRSKWVQMTEAIVSVVGTTDTTVNWGLKYFGSDSLCGVTPAVDVPVAAKNHDAITTSIGATKPSSYTPTRLAENAAAAYLKTVADTNPKYIVLATDGLPNCIPGETDTQMGDEAGAEQSIADALTAGFPTFVVGISTTGTTADDTLNVMAMKGGVPRAGTPSYYSVASTADLQAALKTITGQVVTCNYPLAAAAPTNDPESLTVHIGGMTVAQDPDNGWDYSGPDHTAIKLFGAACDSVTKNPQAKVEVFYGCPGSPPVP